MSNRLLPFVFLITTDVEPLLKSCKELKEACFLEDDGPYMIDPDGQEQGVEPFIVQCRIGNGKVFLFDTIMIGNDLFITLPIVLIHVDLPIVNRNKRESMIFS